MGAIGGHTQGAKATHDGPLAVLLVLRGAEIGGENALPRPEAGREMAGEVKPGSGLPRFHNSKANTLKIYSSSVLEFTSRGP